ncbi:phage major capsid protein [Gellertiella hungarica]|uniref:HK97 family phage major capsid protein n=1 Tax=Gellertiella hungarica TaxID=1572859 RepID=A0A7W6J4N5_9HYPH|nr:phage major capsid protein [Gellertiella hungarica]MBB4064739.1 HK97 family phage major capsid protein [Gellertiella hungarica]
MRHIAKHALAGASLIVLKGEEDDPVNVVTKALDELSKTVDERLKAVEGKSIDPKLDERIKALETKANRPSAGDGKTDKEADEAERKSFGTYLRYGNAAPADELKTLTVSSDTQGGYLAPKEMATEFVRDLTLISPVRAIASVRTTSSPSIAYPKRTGITNAKWKGEGQAQEGSEPSFGQVEIPIREVNTFVDISNQLLADSAGEAEAEVRMALAEDFGAKEGAAFVKGDGVLQPEGFMTTSGIGSVANGHATNLSADALIGMMYALPAQYRSAGTWAMNGTTLGVIRKLKDGQSNYLWQPSYQAGQPETILGRPVVEMPDMPDVASDAFPIIFGDFSGYRIVDRLSLSILVNPYLLATNGLTRIHATRRVGGGVIQPAKFKRLKMATS